MIKYKPSKLDIIYKENKKGWYSWDKGLKSYYFGQGLMIDFTGRHFDYYVNKKFKDREEFKQEMKKRLHKLYRTMYV